MKFVSWRVRPGLVEVERICDMRMGRPVRVARRRRVVRWRWPVNWRRGWCASSEDILREEVERDRRVEYVGLVIQKKLRTESCYR